MPEQAELLTTSLGELLGNARRSMNLSLSDVAQQLKLQVDKIELLEADQWQQFSPVFAKGYAQQFGQFVGIPTDILEAEIKRIECKDAPMRSAFNSPGRQATRTNPYWRKTAYLVAIVLIALVWAYTSFIVSDSEVSPTVSHAEAEQVLVAAVAPKGQLEVELSADSWLSISDAQGQILESALMPGGARYQYRGEPPYQLQIGRVSAAQVWLDGKSIDLPALLSGGVANISVATNAESINSESIN